jgi:hypothetical protein
MVFWTEIKPRVVKRGRGPNRAEESTGLKRLKSKD